ncbi:uncharacterized protein A4U43_C08F700 [Asparagus officinalis]|nr:uncharacterized protein A4U43_C08F700 [Asparagus officinalis]
MGNEDADSGEDDNGEKQRLDEAAKAAYIVKILKAVEFDASVTNNVQQVSLKFKALRSDGQEVIVDDKDLKLNNPLVLINFYEQHLRYSPPTCDVNEQQS